MNNEIIVIVPVYNSEKYIERCMDSIINQTYHNWKMVVVDDGSRDDSINILKKYQKMDKRITVFHQINQGAGAARNKALDYIEKKKYNNNYIVFVDSDDYIEKNYFEELSKHSEDIVFIDVIQRNIDFNIIKYEKNSDYLNEEKDIIIRRQMTGYIPWGGCRKAVKSNILFDNNIRYSNCKNGEEAIYSFLIFDRSKSFGFILKPVYNYILHDDSLSAFKNVDPWGDAVDIVKSEIIKDSQYEKYANTINSFLLTATVISLDRLSQYYSYKEYKEKAKNRIVIYKEKVDKIYGFDKKNTDLRVRFIKPFIDMNLIKIIYLICKVKNRK